MSARTVELFVDPACPYAWMASRWLLNATSVREFTPKFSVMSLSVLNEDQDVDSDYRNMLDDSWGPTRLAVEISRTAGDEAFSRWYTAWGESYHVGGGRDRRAIAAQALEAAGLPASLMDVYAVPQGEADETEKALRASHHGAISRVGQDVGTPVISFGEGTAYFGPVVSPSPKGEDAGRLFDAMETMATLDGFYELKRTRSGGVDFS